VERTQSTNPVYWGRRAQIAPLTGCYRSEWLGTGTGRKPSTESTKVRRILVLQSIANPDYQHHPQYPPTACAGICGTVLQDVAASGGSFNNVLHRRTLDVFGWAARSHVTEHSAWTFLRQLRDSWRRLESRPGHRRTRSPLGAVLRQLPDAAPLLPAFLRTASDERNAWRTAAGTGGPVGRRSLAHASARNSSSTG